MLVNLWFCPTQSGGIDLILLSFNCRIFNSLLNCKLNSQRQSNKVINIIIKRVRPHCNLQQQWSNLGSVELSSSLSGDLIRVQVTLHFLNDFFSFSFFPFFAFIVLRVRFHNKYIRPAWTRFNWWWWSSIVNLIRVHTVVQSWTKFNFTFGAEPRWHNAN